MSDAGLSAPPRSLEPGPRAGRRRSRISAASPRRARRGRTPPPGRLERDEPPDVVRMELLQASRALEASATVFATSRTSSDSSIAPFHR